MSETERLHMMLACYVLIHSAQWSEEEAAERLGITVEDLGTYRFDAITETLDWIYERMEVAP